MGSSSPSITASAILLDIEGTITSISFVKDVLFPHAVNNVERFLGEAWQEAQVQEAIDGMRKQASDDTDAGIEGVIAIPSKDSSKEDQIKGVSENLKWLISIDNKGTHMKALSGLIWQKGYESGDIKGHLYDDVKPAIEKWKENGKKVFIYSSGSVHAQKLIMKYSVLGNLELSIDGYFDTNVGHKREQSSYKNILEKIGFTAEETVFLTDIVEEGDAAKEAELNVVLVSRDGNAPLSEEIRKKYTVISSCAELNLSVTSKRKSSDEENLPPAKIHKNEPNVMEKGESPNKTENPSDSMEVDSESKCTNVIDTPTEIESNKMDKKNLDAEKTEELEKTENICLNTEESQKTLQMETETISNSASSLVIEESNVISSEKTNDCTDIENGTNKDNGTNKETVKEVITELESVTKSDSIEEEALCKEKDKLSPEEIVDVLGEVNTIEESEILMPSEAKATQIGDDAKSNVIIPDCLPVTAEIPIVNNDEDEEKLNQLLGEEGIALEKECEEILSKMEQVTKIDILAQNKVPIHRVIEEKLDDLDDIQVGDDGDNELLLDVENTNSKISVDDLVGTVTNNVLDEILPDIPSEVEPIILNKETNENNGVKEENGTLNTDQHETNGVVDTCDTPKSKTEIVNGKMNNEVNGKDAETLPEKELNGSSKNDIHIESKASDESHTDEKTLDATDVSNQEEIKVKKITSEEPTVETPSIEQAVEA